MNKILVIVLVLLTIIFCSNTISNSETLTQKEILKKMTEDVIILDVRTKSEYKSGHIESAINIPLSLIDENISLDKNKEILVYCQSGKRSKEATKKLKSYGYKVYDIGSVTNYEVVK